jgi:hypothetical protein
MEEIDPIRVIIVDDRSIVRREFGNKYANND